MKRIKIIFFGLLLQLGIVSMAIGQNQPVSADQTENEKNTVIINVASQRAGGIIVVPLNPQILSTLISAPGEVIPNANLTSKVTTRVSAQVLKRTVQEGQHVKTGDVLAILSSVDMAKIQGDLILAAQDWERVKALGKDAISGKRYSAAQVAYQHAYSTALAYGMTEVEINALLRNQKPSKAKGEFRLFAPRVGTVFNINFTEGELIEPGRILLEIVDEATVWVEAKLPPDVIKPVKVGDKGRVLVRGRTLNGQVIQVHHQLDETTRTQAIRLEVPNKDDALHPGQFVNCQIEAGQTKPVLAVPLDAVLKTQDGDWVIYVEKKPEHFQQIEVKVIETVEGKAIIEGVPVGTRVVVKGAFFVHAEVNKKGLDGQGH